MENSGEVKSANNELFGNWARAALESSISAIAITDLQGKLLYVNNAFVTTWGYDSAGEILGKNLTEFSSAGERARSIISEIVAGKTINRESGGIRRDGSSFEIMLSVNPVFSDKGEITHIMGSFIDISARKKADKQLVLTKSRLELMIQGGNIGLWDWNIQSGENIYSARWLEMLGYKPGELANRIEVWEELSHPDDLLIATDILHRHILGEVPHYSVEMRMRHKNGKWKWIFTQGKVMEWDDEGKAMRMTGTHLDITERKTSEILSSMTAERIAAQYRMSLMEDKSEKEIIEYALEEAVNLTNSEVGFVHVIEHDQKTVHLEAWSKKAMENCFVPEAMHYPLADAGIWVNCLKDGKPFVCNDYPKAASEAGYPEGHVGIKRFISTPVYEGDRAIIISGVGNKADDYTDIDVQQYHVFIEEVWKIIKKCRLNAELKAAKEKAEESSQLKSSLLLNMSHEIRTPLNGIMGFSGLLKEELADPGQKNMANLIVLAGKRLMITLTSILELSQLESVKNLPPPALVNFSLLADEVINKFHDEADLKNLHLVQTVEPNIRFASDAGLVSNIMYYLIDNAIKFTDSGTVWVDIHTQESAGLKQVVLKVKDTGIGISDEQLKYIFEPFRQGSEGIGRSHEGSGLGLTLCRKFVNLLGGTLEVESRPGAGSTFTVCFSVNTETATTAAIPVAHEPQEPASAEKENAGGLKRKVLIVEDNLANAELLCQYLRKDYESDIATSGKLAVKYAWQNDYDIILMDINLGPEMDGITATKEIRSMKHYASVPVIAVTGYSTPSERKYILDQGLNDFVSKPFSKSDLISAVNRAVSSLKAKD